MTGIRNAPALNGIVEGTGAADTIDFNYTGDPQGDRIDHNDAILPGQGAQDDIVKGFGGDDLIKSGAGNDTVYGGSGDDTVYGGAGDDLIYGGSGSDQLYGGAGNDEIHGDGGADGQRAAFQWSNLADTDGGKGKVDDGESLSGKTLSQDAGDVKVTVTIPSDCDAQVRTTYDNERINVAGIDGGGQTVNDHSSLDSVATNGKGDAHYQVGFDKPVDNVQFTVSDIDANRGQITIHAYDENGAPIQVHLDAGSHLNLSDTDSVPGNDTVTGTSQAPEYDLTNSVLVSIEGPVSRIEIIHHNAGTGTTGINLSDIYFDSATGIATGDDVIDGGDGDDRLFGDGGNDIIDGGTGNDTIYGGTGDDTIQGGAGNDTIHGDAGNDTIDGGAGSDTIYGGDGADTIFGGSGDDYIDGGAGADIIYGGDGNDTIYGMAGADTIYGGAGDDFIVASADNDIIYGGDGNDNIEGARDNDLIFGDAGDDFVKSGEGDDTVFGGDGNDTIYGDHGDDTLYGGAGDDILRGDNGMDRFFGGAGADTELGQDDEDTFFGGTAGDFVDGGEGFQAGHSDYDVLDLTGSGPLKIVYDPANAENGTVTFLDIHGNPTGTMQFQNIENVIPCFTPGTLIATPRGERPVEELKVGDKVITRDNGIQQIRWLGAKALDWRALGTQPHLKPILIRKGSLGHGLPERDMLVSPNHRVLVANDQTQLYFEEREVLVAAKHLVDNTGVSVAETLGTRYVHFMFDHHEVVLSDGAWTESFQPGDYTLKGIGNVQRAEILALFPDLRDQAGVEGYASARRTLKRHEAQMLYK